MAHTVRAAPPARRTRGTVRAALLINAPPDVVFQAMTHCDEAMRYVPHLRACRELPQSTDPDTRFIEHVIDFGWYAPRIDYVFRADVVPDRRIAFRQVRGDFKANEGVWELDPAGRRTLLRYRVDIDPPGYVPTWLARASLSRELPRLLSQLRSHCEFEQRQRLQANILP